MGYEQVLIKKKHCCERQVMYEILQKDNITIEDRLFMGLDLDI